MAAMRYGVIGAGVLGLTTALRLAQRGHRVTVLDQESVPGGLASSFEVAPGIWLERYYHHIFRTDRAAIRLIAELGLSDRLEWHRPVTTVSLGGIPRQLDSATSLLRLRELRPVDRLRMGAAIAVVKALPRPAPLEGTTAEAWMRRACGERGHAAIWRPLLRAKFGEAAPDVSMAWMWARIHDRTAQLGYMAGGFHQLYRALETAVVHAGGEIRYGARVTGVARVASGLEIAWQRTGDTATGGTEAFDRVISTLSPEVTGRVAPGSVRAAGPVAGAHAPLSAHCLILALDRPLTGIYWIGATDPGWPFLAVVEHTAMLPPSAYGGRHLVYLGAYRAAGDPLPGMPVPEQLSAARDLLRELNPDFDDAWVTDAWTFAAPFAQPIVDTGYRRRIPPLETSLPGLYNASMFHVYPHDRGQNYSIELAERLVAMLDTQGSRKDP